MTKPPPVSHPLLEGLNGVIFGVSNKRSIAWACAQAAARSGARLAIAYQNERVAETVRDLAATLPGDTPCFPCDATSDASIDAFFAELDGVMPAPDFAVHSIAFANKEELEGDYLATSREGFRMAHDVSAYSLTALCQRLAPRMEKTGRGGSIVTMTYVGGDLVIPHYNVMGLAKASLEASVRYLASDLGPRNIRVNAISAGPIRTLAAAGIPNFAWMLDHSRERAPLRRNVEANEVGDATAFLLSEMARGITGQVIFVDAGFSITAL